MINELSAGEKQRSWDLLCKAHAEAASRGDTHSGTYLDCCAGQSQNPYISQWDATAPPTVEDVDWSEITRGVVGR